MHVDLNVFGSLLLYWISAKYQCNLVVKPYDIQKMKLDTDISEKVLKPKCLNDIVYYSSIPDLCGR